ncbi:unnamed protein product [Rotaria socialis]|uniref:Uncharacterized protein n=1 Tax=Rotaria socialis TaxID=392032 RepID=A0A820FLK3_9BILA|nr:unnamed protein product [Rotaria socialis]CAF4601811.1 unnamed protein product [Rotaria socialis]
MMSEYLPQLTPGGLNEYISGRKNYCATLQVLDLKSIKEKAGDNSLTGKRYRLILSDGRHFFSSCVLRTDMVDLVKNDILKINSVIRLNHVDVCNAGVNGSRVILVVQDLTVVLSDCETIGNPVQINDINIAHARVDLLINLCQTLLGLVQLVRFRAVGGKWVIKARVANKSYIREYSNANRNGKVFSAGLVDRTGEIELVAFDHVAEKFDTKLEIGKTYFITKANIVPANQKFNSFKHIYQMVLKINTIIHICEEQDNDAPADIFFNFIPIKEVALRENNTLCDIIGLVSSIDECKFFYNKYKQTYCAKRDIMITDEEASIILTLWEKQAEAFSNTPCSITGIKDAKIYDFRGKSLSSIDSTVIRSNLPKTNRTIQLEALRQSSFENLNLASLTTMTQVKSSVATIEEVLAAEVDLMQHKSTEYFYVRGYCNVIDQDDAIYMCSIVDATGELNVCMFGNAAESLLDTSADAFHQLKNCNTTNIQNIFMHGAAKILIFTIDSKVVEFNMEICEESQNSEKRLPSCSQPSLEIAHDEEDECLQKNNTCPSVMHCQSKFKKMKICSHTDDNVLSEADDESNINECIECETCQMSGDELFQASSASTQTNMDVSTVATQTPWIIYVHQDPNLTSITVKDNDKMPLFGVEGMSVSYHYDSRCNVPIENDSTYICDDELSEFLNKTGK